MKKIALHWQILIGILVGIIVGLLCIQFTGGKEFVIDWIKPFGTIFINLLKLIAIPLIIVSLVKGVSDLKDTTQLSGLGLRTFGMYILTTVVAVTIGLGLVNLIQPGSFISEDTRQEMLRSFGGEVQEKVDEAAEVQQTRGPLQALIDIVPENIFDSMSVNSNMLQIIFFSLLVGVAMISLPFGEIKAFKKVLDAGNAIVLKIVDLMMLFAPYGVFALIATLIAEAPSFDVFKALGMYAFTVVLGLLLLVYGVYSLFVYFFGKMNPFRFFKAILPAQLLGFSTSSSAATLPVTMECAEENLHIRKDVLSFVLPIGATINMDGTCLYQGVAAVFIAQVMGHDLTTAQQLSIIVTATLASIGAAAVPGAGILMLVIVLESIGISPAGIALIFAVDRPLDMLRTATNISGDAMVALLMNRSSRDSVEP
ncbi:dicarboxylate/amino acid:cation symporter [Sphingobacterium corticibacterium]|uniref:Dicarboxylate/amino acid:cation symporter n=1 Tax=Sphingobacterium corticibacterium TaxID=2484746 RepID=A0A4Q6XSB3_9SPHI|nr:dicarboxylate/amino acid:cation symporter [Sphingobacterium corticibacterium]RZF62665.1 dicarboxylate/amino acid:cation symporter [Sphingobacterium corticibacterium]